MDTWVDHYRVLGLPSGEEGTKLTEKEITKAYKSKTLELHPDKRPNDPNAASNFHHLVTSYNILRDVRNLFDDMLRIKCENARREMVSDLERRVREVSFVDPATKEARIARKLKEETSQIRAILAEKMVPDSDTDGVAEMRLKEFIQVHALQHGLPFKPKPGRMHNGYQIYGFGNVIIIIDSLNQKIYALDEGTYGL